MTNPDTRRLELQFRNNDKVVFETTMFEETDHDIQFISYDHSRGRYESCVYPLINLIGWKLEKTRGDLERLEHMTDNKYLSH